MPLPSFPSQSPTMSEAATASQKKGMALFVLLILIFFQIEGEDNNGCNSLLTTVLDMIVLLGLQTLRVALPESNPCTNRQPSPNKPPYANRPPCNPANPPRQAGFTICSVNADELAGAGPESAHQPGCVEQAAALPENDARESSSENPEPSSCGSEH